MLNVSGIKELDLLSCEGSSSYFFSDLGFGKLCFTLGLGIKRSSMCHLNLITDGVADAVGVFDDSDI